MRPDATRVCSLKLLVYEALSYLCTRQVGAVCSYLAEHVCASPNTVDLTKVLLAGGESVRKDAQVLNLLALLAQEGQILTQEEAVWRA